jgi:hypothetical protein
MREKRKSGKHHPVLAKKPAKEISQESEMQELKKVFRGMSETEHDRTLDYLKEDQQQRPK